MRIIKNTTVYLLILSVAFFGTITWSPEGAEAAGSCVDVDDSGPEVITTFCGTLEDENAFTRPTLPSDVAFEIGQDDTAKDFASRIWLYESGSPGKWLSSDNDSLEEVYSTGTADYSRNYFVQSIATAPAGGGDYSIAVQDASDLGDTVMFLYRGSFDPDDPLNHLIAGNDDKDTGAEQLFSAIQIELDKDTRYDIVMTSYDNGMIGDVVFEVRGPAAVAVTDPEKAPVLTAGAVTDTTAALSWTAVAVDDAEDIAIQQWRSGDSGWSASATEEPIAADSMEATVTGLAAETDYRFRLVVASGQNAGISNEVSVTTDEAPVLSSENAITSYSFAEQTGAAAIDPDMHTVDIEVAHDAEVRNLVANFTLSAGASAEVNGVAQASGTTVNDFSSPVTYTVTAEDGTGQDWTVSVTAAPAVNSVTVSPAAASVAQGGTEQLAATVDAVGGASTTVTWTSSDADGKVTVDASGLVSVAADAEPGSYTITATSAFDGTKQGASAIMVTSAPAAPLVYAIAAIADQTAASLIQGYESGSQTTLAIEITNTGTGKLAHLKAAITGTDFVVTQPDEALGIGAKTGFTVRAKDGLAAGTYTATVTVSATNMTDVTFAVTQVVSLPDVTAPSAPTDVSAAAGNGRATIAFASPADDGGSAITGYEVTASPGGIKATGTSSPITITGLTNGTRYTFTVAAINAAGRGEPSAPSNEVTPRRPGGGNAGGAPSGGVTPEDGAQSGQPAAPGTAGADVMVNGRVEPAGTAKTDQINDRTIITIVVDEARLEERLAAEGDYAVVAIPVNADSDVTIGELNGRMVKSMANKQAILEIRTNAATYSLPAGQINIDAISDRLGQSAAPEDIKVRIEIAQPTADMRQAADRAAAAGGFELVAQPVEFHVRAVYGDTVVEVSAFNAYVERMIALPDGADPDRITTGIVIEPDGAVRHVPTKVSLIDGRYYAVISSLTNSAYSVVWHPLAFGDLAGHWAQDAVDDMGSRMIVDGTGDGMFEPDRAITRAEFAAIIVRALGLKPETGMTPFADVSATDWHDSAVHTAYRHGLIAGFADGTFRPNDRITREQAMVIVAKALAITGLQAGLPVSPPAERLRSYADAASVSAWAQRGVSDSLQTGIVTGRSASELAPQAYVTRAETAAIAQRLLQRSGLI